MTKTVSQNENTFVLHFTPLQRPHLEATPSKSPGHASTSWTAAGSLYTPARSEPFEKREGTASSGQKRQLVQRVLWIQWWSVPNFHRDSLEGGCGGLSSNCNKRLISVQYCELWEKHCIPFRLQWRAGAPSNKPKLPNQKRWRLEIINIFTRNIFRRKYRKILPNAHE